MSAEEQCFGDDIHGPQVDLLQAGELGVVRHAGAVLGLLEPGIQAKVVGLRVDVGHLDSFSPPWDRSASADSGGKGESWRRFSCTCIPPASWCLNRRQPIDQATKNPLA